MAIFTFRAVMWVIKIDKGDALVTEQDLAVRVASVGLAQGDREAAQSLADMEVATAITEPAFGLDLAHLEAGWIVDGRQGVGKRDRTGAIAAGRSGQAQCVVRTEQVVAIAEVIELALALVERGEVEVAQHFELERAMEALVLALGLRMISTAMGDSDAEPDQPQAKRGEGM